MGLHSLCFPLPVFTVSDRTWESEGASTLTMAKLAPSAFALAQSTLPCQAETSKPCGFDLVSRREGLALTSPKAAATRATEYFIMNSE
jgi:hypothetical protein